MRGSSGPHLCRCALVSSIVSSSSLTVYLLDTYTSTSREVSSSYTPTRAHILHILVTLLISLSIMVYHQRIIRIGSRPIRVRHFIIRRGSNVWIQEDVYSSIPSTLRFHNFYSANLSSGLCFVLQ